MNRKTKIFIITFFSIVLIPVIVISIILGYNDKKLNDKINKSKYTRILMLNNIDNPITFEELCDIESSKEYKIEDVELRYENEKDRIYSHCFPARIEQLFRFSGRKPEGFARSKQHVYQYPWF